VKKAYIAASILAGFLIIMTQQDASAQLAANKGYSLTGTGFAVSQDSIADSTMELMFTTNSKKAVVTPLSTASVVIDGNDITLSNFKASVLYNGQIIRLTSTATNADGDELSLKLTGRQFGKTSSESAYSITGTITDSSNKATRLVYTAKISEFSKLSTTDQKSDVTVKILKGAANPSEQTYKEASGFRFNFFSDARLTILPGTTVTFVNEDTAFHSLKTGTVHHKSQDKSFVADGRISTGDIEPGKSKSVKFDQRGFYQLYDENYNWMNITIFVSDSTTDQNIKPAKKLN
jgi:plastocyanin